MCLCVRACVCVCVWRACVYVEGLPTTFQQGYGNERQSHQGEQRRGLRSVRGQGIGTQSRPRHEQEAALRADAEMQHRLRQREGLRVHQEARVQGQVQVLRVWGGGSREL